MDHVNLSVGIQLKLDVSDFMEYLKLKSKLSIYNLYTWIFRRMAR